jgi:hypothetical protein
MHWILFSLIGVNQYLWLRHLGPAVFDTSALMASKRSGVISGVIGYLYGGESAPEGDGGSQVGVHSEWQVVQYLS